MSRSQRKTWFLAGALVLAACLPAGRSWAWSVEISEEQVQGTIETAFPVRQQIAFATAVFSDPRVRIDPATDRVKFAVAIEMSVASDVTAAGWAEIEGVPGYDPSRGEFHLLRPAVTGLRFDSLQPEYVEIARTVANAMAEQLLPGVVIYRLDERDFRQGVMRRSLKGLSVEDGKLIAELDW